MLGDVGNIMVGTAVDDARGCTARFISSGLLDLFVEALRAHEQVGVDDQSTVAYRVMRWGPSVVMDTAFR